MRDEIRQFMNRNAAAVTVVMVIVIVVCLATMMIPGGAAIPDLPADYDPGLAYFLDIETGERFVASAKRVPPFINDAGNESVRASVYGCGNCEADRQFVAHYMKFTDGGKAVVERWVTFDRAFMADPSIAEEQLVSSTGEADSWVPINSPEGNQVTGGLFERCPNNRPVECQPPAGSVSAAPPATR